MTTQHYSEPMSVIVTRLCSIRFSSSFVISFIALHYDAMVCSITPCLITYDFEMQVSDGDHIDRLISCLYMALPFFVV